MKNFFTVLIAIVLAVAVIYSFLMIHARWRSNPAKINTYDTDNPFIVNGSLIVGHRMGGGDAPEESLMALEMCLSGNDVPDVLEMDLHITKDGRLVLLHDDTLDRTTDSRFVFGKEGLKTEDLTLEELKKLNIGVSFVDKDGAYPYKDLHGENVPDTLRILTLEEFLDYSLSRGDFRYIIEIKNGGEEGKRALDILYATIKERNLLDRVIFGTFKNEITEYASSTYPDLIRSASIKEALEFYIAALCGKKNYEPPVSVLQVFYGKQYFKFGVNLATSRVINYAHSHNMAIQYWTVNEEEDIEYLLSVGADGIMTDYVEKAMGIKGRM